VKSKEEPAKPMVGKIFVEKSPRRDRFRDVISEILASDDPKSSVEQSEVSSLSLTEENNAIRPAAAKTALTDLRDETTDEVQNERKETPQRRRTVVIRPPGREESADEQKLLESRLAGFLVSYTLDPSGRVFEIRGSRNIIGSGGRSTIRIEDDPTISEEHAVLVYRDGKFRFWDNGSQNGSFVNGKEADEPMEVQHGAVIEMGNTSFILVTIERAT
jgi:pSer/pThr/pTyr-binding forkhead associated (FHA) protein